MDSFLNGKVAMVTGGTRGIGFETVKLLLQAGATVSFCGRTAEGVASAVNLLEKTPLTSGDKVHGAAVDLLDAEGIVAWFTDVNQRFGRIDILVNNAGIGRFASVKELDWEAWRQTIDTNLTAAYVCAREAVRRFGPEGGAIVNIASLASRNPFAGGAAYNASKFGMLGFADALMLDHRQDNVRVSTILPGSVATDFSPRSAGMDDSWKIAPEDVAEVVLNVLRMSGRTLVSLVEMRPARPKRV